MANLAVTATGNFSAAATWQLIDTTSFLQSQVNNTASTTSFVSSSAFTPGAITIDGIGLYVAAHSGAPSGTFSTRLAQGGVAVAGTTVTINSSDIDAPTATNGMGWHFFKFATPVTLAAATAYTVQIQSSVNAQVNVYRDATAANWSRFLRTTTTQAPAAGDQAFMQGAWTGAGAQTAYTVTMDLDGSGALNLGSIEVAKGSTFQFSTAASTTTWLQMQGDIKVWSSGLFTIGTVGTPIPTTSTAYLIFNCTANVQYGMTINSAGIFKSHGDILSNDRAMLAADIAIGATTITTDISTGWKSGDQIAIASTTRTVAESEEVTLSADATGTSIPIGATSFAHSGTSPTQAEIIITSRNIIITGITGSLQGYINVLNTSIVDIRWTKIQRMGSATASKRGIDVQTTTGSFTMQHCCLRQFTAVSSLGLNLTLAANNNISISDCFFFSMAGNSITTTATATTGLAISITNCIGMLNTAGGIFNILNCKITFTGNKAISGAAFGITLNDTSYNGSGTISDLTVHSCGTVGIQFSNLIPNNKDNNLFSNFAIWRCGTFGLVTSTTYGITIDTVNLFGNTTANMEPNGATHSCVFKNITSNAGVTLTAPAGLAFASGVPITNCYFDNCSFGATTTHATGDINYIGVAFTDIVFRNCTFNSATTVANQANSIWNNMIKMQRINGTAGNHKTFKKFGTVLIDTTLPNTGGESTRLTPNSALYKLESGSIKFAIANGETATINIFVRKSVVGDGTAYNGNQPRLIQKANPALGITSDIVLATADNTFNGAYKALTATITAPTDNGVVELVVDCDGTTGWINIDDASFFGVPNLANIGTQKYWDEGLPATILPPPIVASRLVRGLVI